MDIPVFRHWWALTVRGGLAMLFGMVALFWPRLTLGALVICFGTFALVGGLFAIVLALGDRGRHTRWGALLIEGLVGIVIGLLTFFWPLVTALILLYLIAIWALMTGVLELTVAAWIHQAGGNAWMLLLGGIASLLFGVLLAALPGVGLLALTWLIGIYALVFGILLVTLSFQWRWIERQVAKI